MSWNVTFLCKSCLIDTRKKEKATQGWYHCKHGLRKRRRSCRTAKYSRYQADSNPRPQRVWHDHGPLGFQGSCPWYNSMVHEVWGRQKDHPSGLDRNTVQILALSFHITGHHAPTRASFHSKTRGELPLWYQIILGFEKYIGEGVTVGFPPFWHPFCWFF